MKNKHPKKSVAGLASLKLSDKENNSSQNPPKKTVIADECGDSLWDDVLEKDKSNLLANDNGANEQSTDEQGKIKKD